MRELAPMRKVRGWMYLEVLEVLEVLDILDILEEGGGEGAGADAEGEGVDVGGAHDVGGLLSEEESLFGCAYGTCRLEAHGAPCGAAVVGDGCEHCCRALGGGACRPLACRGLDEVGAGVDGELCGVAYEGGCGEVAGLDDDLEGAGMARLAHGCYLVGDLAVVACEECAAVDDDVDLVGALTDGVGHLVDLEVERQLTVREGSCHRCHADGGTCDCLLSHGDEARVDAHRSHVGCLRCVQRQCLAAEGCHGGVAVGGVEGGVVDAGQEGR